MDTWLKVVIGGAVAYFAYEWYYGTPASWTAVGGTAAQWSALSAAGQSQWNALPAASQTSANALSLIQNFTTATAQTAAAPAAVVAATTATSAPIATAAAAAPVAPCVPAPAGQPWNGCGPDVSSLASLASVIQSSAASDPNLVNGLMPTGDHWNYYANLLTGKTLPAAWPSGPLTFAQYWAAESPVIAAQTGLGSVMAGLGALIQRGRTQGMGAYVQQSERYAFASEAAGPMTPFFFDADTASRSWN